jgi:hypothetical protein
MRWFLPVLLLSFICASCGGGAKSGDPPRHPGRPPPDNPRLPENPTAERARKSLGHGPENCGEAVLPLGDTSCRMQPVFECLLRAYQTCRPAYGTHMFVTSEGDPIRIDYFVKPSAGPCALVVVEDRSADPVGNKGIEERSCSRSEWQPDPANSACQSLAPLECRTLSRS